MRTRHLYRSISLLLLIFNLFTANSSALAQTVNKESTVVVDIIVDDTAMLKDATVDFSLIKDGINSNYNSDTNTYDFRLTGRETRAIIPLSTAVNYGRISYVWQQEPLQQPLDGGNNLFIFQPGDTIKLHLSLRPKDIFFTGKYAAKYNCMYEISNSDEITSVAKYNVYKDAKNFEAAFNYRRSQLDTIFNLQLHILENFKTKIDPTVYELIKLDCQAKFNQYIVDLLYLPFEWQKIEEFAVTKKMFFDYYENLDAGFVKDTALLLESYNYGDFLVKKEKVYATLVNSTGEKSYYPALRFGDINTAIDLHYKDGPLKDKIKLLAFYNIDRRRQGDFSRYIDEVIQESSDNVYGQALKHFKSNNADQADAYPFELTDETGKLRNLSDFKGKVVVMDFWFTGCGGCLAMAKTLKPIAAAYKSNPLIVFITVSIDRDRQRWLKSLKEEKYSSADEVNLFAGMDRQSSIVKHYNINMYPTLIIISPTDKILSVAPPDPRINLAEFNDYLTRVCSK